MQRKLLSLLNIRQSESRYVFDLLPIQFFTGIATSFITIIAISLFLSEYPVNQLPYVYLIIAVSFILVNIVYQKLEHKYAPLILLKHIVSFSAVIIFLLWIGLRYINEHYFTFLLFIWSVIFYMVSGYAFWGLVSILFNVRESKRVFSIVSSGDIPAKLVGYLSASLLTPLIGTGNLLWLALVSLLAGLLLLIRIIHKRNWERIAAHSHNHDHGSNHSAKEKNRFTFFFENPLIFSISLLSLISYNVFNLIDFTFLSQVKTQYHTIESLSTFIATLLALGRLVALIMKLVLTSRVIERLGIIASLFITPLLLFLFCLVFLLGIHQPEHYVYVFGFMFLLTEILRSVIQEPVFFILFQPLKESLRLKGHIISKGYMQAPSYLIVGASLIVFYKTGIDISIPLTFKIIVINLIVWGIIIYFIRKTYLQTLHDSIRKGLFNSEEVHIHDEKTAAILINKVQSGNENEIIYALHLLEKAQHPSFSKLLEEQLQSPLPAVRQFALTRMDSQGLLTSPTLWVLWEKETDTDVKDKIISLLCKYDKPFLAEASQKLQEYPISMRRKIMAALLNQTEFSMLLAAGNELNQLIHSSHTNDKLAAIDIIGELKNARFTDDLKRLIADTDITVKRNAVITACKLQLKELVPDIAALFNHSTQKYIAMQGFIQYGDAFFTHNKQFIVSTCRKFEEYYIKIAGRTKGNSSTDYLLYLLQENATEKTQLADALWSKEFIATNNKETEPLQTLLTILLAAGTEKIKYYHLLPSTKEYALIKKSIQNEIRNDLDTVLKLCAILFDRNETNRTLELIATHQHSRIINAMEMLEMILPKKIMKEINHLFDFIYNPEYIETALYPQDTTTIINEVIFNQSLLFQPWSKAVCIYESWKNNLSKVLLFLQRQPVPENSNPLIHETREYVLKRINTHHADN